MIRQSGFTLIELMLVVVIIGILAATAVPNYIAMQARAKEANIMESAHTVQLAAEAHAVLNQGIYSDLAADLVPHLPSGALLDNPFTNQPTEPQFGAVAATPGQIGIVGVIQSGAMVGYTITGYGKDELILTYTNG